MRGGWRDNGKGRHPRLSMSLHYHETKKKKAADGLYLPYAAEPKPNISIHCWMGGR